ncbi:MAG: class I tRNA ligase family protein [Actinomycetota bacterium]|nr:class I tRNA ligase family protein [Actinomycetota bacterium]
MKATYAEVEFEDQCLVMAGDLVESVFGERRQLQRLSANLAVKNWWVKYEPIYDYAQDNTRAYKVVAGDFVSTKEGTGIVHIAPAFGEDDMNVGLKNNLPVVQMVDYDGKF